MFLRFCFCYVLYRMLFMIHWTFSLGNYNYNLSELFESKNENTGIHSPKVLSGHIHTIAVINR